MSNSAGTGAGAGGGGFGETGAGYAADNAPALANPDFLSVARAGFLSVSIRYGRPGTPMSAW